MTNAPTVTVTSWPIGMRLRAWLARETTGGALLLISAVLALLWANSPWRASYSTISETALGPTSLGLDLPLSTWASDGLLAIFFFVVGLELKQEFVVGSLRDIRRAAVPVLAAVGGMLTPALFYSLLVTLLGAREALHGWAIPTATDIAFTLAVLALFGRGLPRGLRTFLLTLAVFDDLLAITVIAVFYTSGLDWAALAAALGCVGLFAVLVRMRRMRIWTLLPVAVAAWGFMHASGVHATIAGVLMGLFVPAVAIQGEVRSRAGRVRVALEPVSTGIVLPVFAFFAAGVSLSDGGDLTSVLREPVFVAVVVALVLGKLIGVMGTTALVTGLTPLRLPGDVGLRDLVPVGLLTGIGFTVSLLIAGLSFTDGVHTTDAKAAVLLGSTLSATLGAFALRRSARHRATPEVRDGE